MTILGIETSCDDTGIAVVEARGRTWPPTWDGRASPLRGGPKFRILSNVVASQVKLHQKYGGVYPHLAKREHQVNLPIVLRQALKRAHINTQQVWKIDDIDAIAVTHGPGLSPCLWAGINFAKDLAKKYNVPLIPVDHMEGHMLVGLFSQSNENFQFSNPKSQTNSKHQIQNSKQIFPAIVLLVSGGHTQLLLMKEIGKYQLLGETRDDAAGEAFDKTARILGLGYPGGPAIAKLASAPWLNQGAPWFSQGIRLPRPMFSSNDYDFSFSGLKTAVLYDAKKRKKSKEYVQAMAKEIQQAIVDVLLKKTLKAASQHKAKSIILGGGVAANEELREQLKNKAKAQRITLFLPEKSLATDNGIMPALAGYFAKPQKPETIAANPNLRLVPH